MQDLLDTLQTQLESAVDAMKTGQAQVQVAHDEAKRLILPCNHDYALCNHDYKLDL